MGLPTETVYGLAARALDPGAVARIYAAKSRPTFNPLIAHVGSASLDALDGRVIDLSQLHDEGRRTARRLTSLWPGPLTLVLPRGPAVPDLTTAGLDTVGVRCPDHPVARALLARVDGPLAAPSANRSGRISPTTADDVVRELGDAVQAVLDGGPCAVGLESSVVFIARDGAVTLLRPGATTRATLEQVLGRPVALADGDPSRPRSPGMTSRHYAPDTPFLLLPGPLQDHTDTVLAAIADRNARRVALLAWGPTTPLLPGLVEVQVLAPDGQARTAAHRLFAALRALDGLQADLLLAEPIPDSLVADGGLGHALRDRLARAVDGRLTPRDGPTPG